MRLISWTSAITLGMLAGCGPSNSPFATPTSPPDPGGPGNFPEKVLDAPLVLADSPPPPISGGTLTLLDQGHKAAVADPDHDQVVIVDLDLLKVTSTIALRAGDEPGRSVEDAAGRVHVALRRGGDIVTIDPTAGSIVGRRTACANPRGLAYDAKADAVHVACVGGELVTFPAAGGNATRELHLDHDLRDVVVDGDHLLVSRFRAAELLVIEADGHMSARLTPPGRKRPNFDDKVKEFTPAVAWRTVPNPDGGAIMVFQEEQTTEVRTERGGYGSSGCSGGIMQSAVAVIRADGAGWTSRDLNSVLPVDIAVAPGGSTMSIARAGVIASSPELNASGRAPILTFDPVDVQPIEGNSCGGEAGDGPAPSGMTAGQAVAVAYDPGGRLIVQTRDPATLVVNGQSVRLPGASTQDSGHQLFHMSTSGGLACASCHPEGREDGHVWKFADFGARRTQSIGGGLLGSEPFHWSGDMTDFKTLAHDVFTSRMSGPALSERHSNALANWIDRIPAWRTGASVDPAGVERGRALFNSSEVGCATCHVGEKLTNNTTVDVGTGEALQVPSLRGVAYRAPYMHQGCAKTLNDRFGDCGGGDKHGKTSALNVTQRADLVTFLSTL